MLTVYCSAHDQFHSRQVRSIDSSQVTGILESLKVSGSQWWYVGGGEMIHVSQTIQRHAWDWMLSAQYGNNRGVNTCTLGKRVSSVSFDVHVRCWHHLGYEIFGLRQKYKVSQLWMYGSDVARWIIHILCNIMMYHSGSIQNHYTACFVRIGGVIPSHFRYNKFCSYYEVHQSYCWIFCTTTLVQIQCNRQF